MWCSQSEPTSTSVLSMDNQSINQDHTQIIQPLTISEPTLIKRPIYIDYNATTPIDKHILNELQYVSSTVYGNPSSSYSYGIQAKQLMDTSRQQCIHALNGTTDSIFIFTSCATESINIAIQGIIKQYNTTHKNSFPHIITSSIEHVAVLNTVKYLTQHKYCTSTILPVNKYGCVDIDTLTNAIESNTILISIILANNEIGTINNIQQLCHAAKQVNPNVLFHTDASQAMGKSPVDVQLLNIDLLSVAGHKVYTFKGIGGLYIKNNYVMKQIQKLLHGAEHEYGVRAGTENTLYSWSLGYGMNIAHQQLHDNIKHMNNMKQLLYDTIISSINSWIQHYTKQQSPYITDVLYLHDNISYIKVNDNAVPLIHINSSHFDTLCNTLSISFAYVNSTELLSLIQHDICASAGSACHSSTHTNTISHVLHGIQLPDYYALGTLRLSTGKYNTDDEMNEAGKIIAQNVISLLIKQYCSTSE